jgi:hypothetical protein
MNTLAPQNQSLLVDTSGMVHNQSIDVNPEGMSEGGNSPGMRSQRLRGIHDPIEEEHDEQIEEGSGPHDSASISKRSGVKSVGKSSKMKVNFNGMPSVMSNQTLKNGAVEKEEQYTGSERSKLSLRASKNADPGSLKDSIRQNNRKVTGASNIKSLIRSAATRD